QAVLHHLVLGSRGLQLLPQVRQLPDGEAPVLGEHRGLRVAQPLLQAFDALHLGLGRHFDAPLLPRAMSYFLNWLETRCASTWMPGPIVDDTVMDRRYCPFEAAGFARTIASSRAVALATSCSLENDFLPTGTWTLPALSTRNSTLPAFTSRTARDTSKVTVPSLGFGMSPRGPSTLPSLPTWPMRSGVAMVESNSIQPPWIRSTRS